MMHYEISSNQLNYSPFVNKKPIVEAIQYMITFNLSIRQAAELFNISKSTLHRGFKKQMAQQNKEISLELIAQLNKCQQME
ncbi:stage_III sporulation protein [Hexamita inflata]|uniref:Stage III sporulation protein n=1 Tax=Hexamita inflata TaxID=28002 RepID=A0AA86TWL3_9EUKA|nr:stage III sporulation protein [Hexamita inflata]